MSIPLALPAGGPADRDTVKGLLSITDTLEDDRLTAVVDGVNAVVSTLPAADRARGSDRWPASVVEGATQLAARMHMRGRATFGAADVPVLAREDPDLAMLLGLGSWASPAVG